MGSPISATSSPRTDKRYKLIRKLKVSTAAEHDTRHLEDVLDSANPSRDVSGDQGFEDHQREARLKAQGWRVQIQRKAAKGQSWSNGHKRRNTRIARTRARVEHVFASLAQMGGKALRCIGLARAILQLHCKAATYTCAVCAV